MIKACWVSLLFWGAIVARAETVALCGVEWPPFTYGNPDTGLIESGISYDIYQSAFDRLGMDFEAKVMPWPRCLRMVEEARYSGVIDNAALEPYIAGVHPTAVYPLAVYVRHDFPHAQFSWEAMEGKVIGMVRGYDYTPKVKAFNGWQSSYFTTDEQMLRVLKAGHIDYVLGDLFSVPILSERVGVQIRRLDPLVDSTELFLVFNRKQSALMERYDAMIGRMIEDGTLDAIYSRNVTYTYHELLELNARVEGRVRH